MASKPLPSTAGPCYKPTEECADKPSVAWGGQAIRQSSVCPLSIAVPFPTLLVPRTEPLPQFWESTSQMYMAKIQIMQSHYCPQKKKTYDYLSPATELRYINAQLNLLKKFSIKISLAIRMIQ